MPILLESENKKELDEYKSSTNVAGQRKAMFAKGYLKKNAKGKMVYSKKAGKKGRPPSKKKKSTAKKSAKKNESMMILSNYVCESCSGEFTAPTLSEGLAIIECPHCTEAVEILAESKLYTDSNLYESVQI